MRIRTPTLLAAAALVLVAAPASAQNQVIDSRWLAYVGCWESVGLQKSTVCLLPVGETAVDLVTIDSGVVVAAERIVAGTRVATAQGECTGWQMAEWSVVSDRLYLQSEETCPRWGTRSANGVIALSRSGQLLYIQGGTVGLKTGVEVQRYRAASALALPSEVTDALEGARADLTATTRARAAAMAPLMIDDVAEASRHLANDVVEAWLVERGGAIILDARRLVQLADAGVPAGTIDVLVALAYPRAFAINARLGARREFDAPLAPSYGACDLLQPYGYGYGSSYCDGFGGLYGYGYPYDWYPRYPYVIVYTGPGGGGGGAGGGDDGSRAHGRVLNGRGYHEGEGSTADVSRGEPRPGTSGSSSGTSTRTTGSTSSSGEQRTAKPRP